MSKGRGRPKGKSNEELEEELKEICKVNGYEYISKYWKRLTLINCKCDKCGVVNEFKNHSLRNGSIKCKGCEKKSFVKGFIYKIEVGDYYYIGITSMKIRTRFVSHCKSCFNKRKNKVYSCKKYRIIREYIRQKTGETPTVKDFYKYVSVKKVCEVNTSWEDLKSLEGELINLNNPWCMNSIN